MPSLTSLVASLRLMLALVLLTAAAPVLAERFLGTTPPGAPPFAVHAELEMRGEEIGGVFTTPEGSYRVEGRLTGGEATGRISAGALEGRFTLVIEGDRATGTFSLGPASGTLDLRRTEKSAQEAFATPTQRLHLSKKEWEQDFAELVRILTKEHGAPFHRVSEAAFRRAADTVRQGIPLWDGPRIAAEFRRLSMMIGDGHTGVALPAGLPRYPLRLFWFEDGVRVIAAMPEHEELLGAAVTAANGIPIQRVVARLRPFSPLGESEWSYRGDLPTLLVRPDLLTAAGIASGDEVTLTFRLPNGRSRRAVLRAGPFPQAGRVLLGGAPPIWERLPEEPLWFRDWPGSATLYANFRSYEDLALHAAALGAALDERRPARLIIDMRGNGGGDYQLGRALLIPQITSRPWINRPDALFVLVGRNTFSAAMANAADFGSMTNATMVGEPIGENPNSWQEPRHFYLPHSGLRVAVSTRYYSFAPTGTDAIVPDIHAPPHWRDWVLGLDSGVAAVWTEVLRRQIRPSEPDRRSR